MISTKIAIMTLAAITGLAGNGVRPVYAYCFEAAGSQYGIAPEILTSIADKESGLISTALNYNTDGSYDFGVMQINTINEPVLRRQGIEWSTLGDPCTNVMAGALLLRERIREYGYNWKAIGAYHSKTPSKRDAYARKIAKILKKKAAAATRQQHEQHSSLR